MSNFGSSELKTRIPISPGRLDSCQKKLSLNFCFVCSSPGFHVLVLCDAKFVFSALPIAGFFDVPEVGALMFLFRHIIVFLAKPSCWVLLG